MVIIITPNDALKEIEKKIEKLNASSALKRMKKLQSLFGKLKFDQDPLKLQKEWLAENA